MNKSTEISDTLRGTSILEASETNIQSLVDDVRSSVEEAQNAALGYAIRIGKDLLRLQAVCKHKRVAFGSLFPQSIDERGDPQKLPFSQATGSKLIAIARHDLLADFSHAKNVLPTDWTTLYYLARLPARKLRALIDEGRVHPEMSRADAMNAVMPVRQDSENPSATAAPGDDSEEPDPFAYLDALIRMNSAIELDEVPGSPLMFSKALDEAYDIAQKFPSNVMMECAVAEMDLEELLLLKGSCERLYDHLTEIVESNPAAKCE